MRTNFLHVFIKTISFTLLLLCQPTISWGDDIKKGVSLDSKSFNGSRTPANFIPNDDIEPNPIVQKLWFEKILIKDNAGIVDQTKDNLLNWHNVEEYREQWDVASTGLYKTPDADSKKNYLSRNLISYIDKRVAGEIKSAPKGSTLHTVATVQKALKPQTEVNISPKLKIKVKARIIQAKAIIKFVNPYLHAETEVKLNGRIGMQMSKRIDYLGMDAQINYNVTEGQYTAFLSKRLTSKITSKFSATQDDDHLMFTNHSDNKMEVFYTNSF